MPGVKGMTNRRPRNNAIRITIWENMRILRKFTIPELCMTTGSKVNNTRKFIRRLAEHGYVAKMGRHVPGRAGSYQGWQVVKDPGPVYPMRCDECGRPLGEPCGRRVAGSDGRD